ncbi:MAG: asparaginase [Planctomycetota bacterium]
MATRGGVVESEHLGHAVVVRGGEVVAAWGDPDTEVWCRSAVKPLQALPLFDRGVVDRLGLADEELALISASHQGTPMHVEVVDRILHKAGLGRDALACGPHSPFDRRAGLDIARAGGKPERIHNNCSGKHAGFLLLAQACGTPLDEYLIPESATQTAVRAAVAEMMQLAPSQLGVAVDGCGAPTLRAPLSALARAFWRLTNPQQLPAARRAACGRLLQAVSAAPYHLAGRGRLCSALIESAPGRVYPKNGAEGVYAVGVAGLDLGVAIKVSDGAERAYVPVVVALLRRLGLWREVPPALADFARLPLRNTRDELVGHVECVIEGGASA